MLKKKKYIVVAEVLFSYKVTCGLYILNNASENLRKTCKEKT